MYENRKFRYTQDIFSLCLLNRASNQWQHMRHSIAVAYTTDCNDIHTTQLAVLARVMHYSFLCICNTFSVAHSDRLRQMLVALSM